MRVRAANTHRGCYSGTVFVCLNRAYRTWSHLSLNVSLKQSESYSISARSCIFLRGFQGLAMRIYALKMSTGVSH